MSLPPFGALAIRFWSKFVDRSALSACTNGAGEVTSTVWEVEPTAIFTSAIVACPTETAIFVSVLLKPSAVILSVYLPGGRSEKRYAPLELVVVVRAAPVASLLKATLALAKTAPLGSVTVPARSPETSDCAINDGGTTAGKHSNSTTAMIVPVFICPVLSNLDGATDAYGTALDVSLNGSIRLAEVRMHQPAMSVLVRDGVLVGKDTVRYACPTESPE